MAFNISYVYQAVDRFTPVARKISRSVGQITKKVRASKQALQRMGGALVSIGKKAAITGTIGLGLAIRSYSKFEDALLGVAKTANIAVGPELDQLGNKFTELSLKMPVSAVELLNLGQAAAQLGVEGKDNILNFAGTMAKLATASNVAGEEGAAQLARLIKITGGSTAQVSNFASALVELGNTTAATEAEILQFGTQLAGAGALYGITGTQALALAAAMRAMGIQSEVGSSVVGRSLGTVNKAIRKGGQDLKNIAFLTGIAGKDLKKAFSKDAIGVIAKMGAGLEKMQAEGKDVANALSVLGLEGIRDIRVLGSLAKNSDLVNQKLAQSARAFKENIALQKEYTVKSDSLSSKTKILSNSFSKMGKQLGIIFNPALERAIASMTTLTSKINDHLASLINVKNAQKAASNIQAQANKLRRETEGRLSAPKNIFGDVDVNQIQSNINAFLGKKEVDRHFTPIPGMNQKQQSTINGNITVEALQGTAIKSIESSSNGADISLGQNMAGAGT